MGIIKPSMAKKPMMHQVAGGKKGGGKAPWAKGGGKGFKGGKGGQPAGVWTFVPAAAPAPMWGGRQVIQQAFGKGGKHGKAARQVVQAVQQVFSKGGGKGFKGGKGKGDKGPNKYKFMDKLDTIDAERKVWVGGLPKDVTRGNIVEHFKAVSNPGVFDILGRGTACISFKTAEDASNIIASLNGTDLNGTTIEVDVWTKKEKKERPEGAKPERKKTKSGLATTMLKGKKKPGNSMIQTKLKEVDHSLKVWVGNFSKTTTWKQIKQHFVDNGCEVDMCDLNPKPGSACVSFKTEDEASSAVASINGTELDDCVLEVDVWKKPEKREKKPKAE